MSAGRPLTFSITPFYLMRQYYYAIEEGIVEPEGVDLALEYLHSPEKDQVLLCGRVDATTMSMGKYCLAKTISDTYTLPTDPFAIAAESTMIEANGLFAPTDSDIDDPQDLVGKRVGFHDKSLSLVYHKTVLEDVYDVPTDEIEWVFDTHQGLTEQMEAGTIDAIERVSDWYWNLKDSPEFRRLYSMGEKWYDLYGYYPIVHVVAVDKAYYDAYPDAIDSFVDALQASKAYRDENRDAILETFATESDELTESTVDRDLEKLTEVTEGMICALEMGDTQRQNIQDWLESARRFDVIHQDIDEERLYPL